MTQENKSEFFIVPAGCKSYDRYQDWEREVKLFLGSVYNANTDAYKSRLVQLWMGKESFPLVKMWEDAGDLPRDRADAEEIFQPHTLPNLMHSSSQNRTQ